MTTIPSNLRRVLRREPRVRPTTEPVAAPPERVETSPVEIAPNDPLVAYFSSATGAVDICALQLDSPALAGLREAGIKLVVPLVSQGELIGLLDDQIGIVVGDVTDKGVPAALVMATTHSILRAEAPRLVAPSEVLTRANDLLADEMPAHMFVTCLYAVLNPATGRLRYANAGHNVPYVSTEAGVTELRATGMPLGLLPGMEHEEKEATLAPGEIVLLHSDGLAEAHNGEREMFGFPRIIKAMENCNRDDDLIDALLAELDRFTGPD